MLLQRLHLWDTHLPFCVPPSVWEQLHSSCFSNIEEVCVTHTHAQWSPGIKTSWEEQSPGCLDNLNQTNCLNASILCHYVRQGLSADGLKARQWCVCVYPCVCLAGGCWAPRSTWQILFCSGKSARLCQHWGSATTTATTQKKEKKVQDIRGFISFLLSQGLFQCMCETEECTSALHMYVCVCVCHSAHMCRNVLMLVLTDV